ncbi:hypothetical protein ACFO5Q_09745 [Kordiimonas lipolytica]|uniref:Uncharacterized protein n=1 Tax=Kordiimonas lipolytica TaxID=1662421 RepID=A0ABV8UAA0_9PROT|nr:hypothetical protein [Kordiimonas lipolytica]
MNLDLDAQELELLRRLKTDVSQISVYKTEPYPSAVSFELSNGGVVTLTARSEDVAPRFEVFPLQVTDRRIAGDADLVIPCGKVARVEVLKKAEWDEPASSAVIEDLLGQADGATLQCEGGASDTPENAINRVRLDAGIRCRLADGKEFAVATSMFPFSLYVADCGFSEPLDLGIYDFVKLD